MSLGLGDKVSWKRRLSALGVTVAVGVMRPIPRFLSSSRGRPKSSRLPTNGEGVEPPLFDKCSRKNFSKLLDESREADSNSW